MLLFQFAAKIQELVDKGFSQQEAAQKLGVKIQGLSLRRNAWTTTESKK